MLFTSSSGCLSVNLNQKKQRGDRASQFVFHKSILLTHLKEDKPSTSGASVIRVDVHSNITRCSCPQVKIRVDSERFQLNVTLLRIWSTL